MSNVRAFLCAVFALLGLSPGLQAQANRLFVFPSGGSLNTAVLDATTLANVGTVVASPNAFKALAVPDGSKYYVISNNAVRTITVVSASNLAAPRYIDLGANASAAVITGDGRKLLVSAGTLKVFDTSTDRQIADVGVGGGPTDIEVTNDSRTAYVISTGAGLVSVVDLTANPPALLNQISIGSPFSMAMRPDNKNLLVLVPNGIAVISVKTNTLLSMLPLNNVTSGKILVTPDSARAVVVNRGTPPLNSSQVVDLSSGNATAIGGGNLGFDDIAIANSSTAFGLVSRANTVTRIDLPTAATTDQSYGLNSRALDFSPNGKVLYLSSASGSSVTRVDLSSNAPVTQSVGVAPTGLSAVFPPPASGAANISINGGDKQTVIAGQTTIVPLSVKVTTADGSPVFNVPVTFSTTASGVTFDPPLQPSRTNSKGIAQANAIIAAASLRSDDAPALTADGAVDQFLQTITITASAGGAGAITFTLTLGSGSGLQVISGDLQITRPQQPFLLPFVVRVTDANGFPQAGISVTFFAGSGIILPPLQVATSDADGIAQATFSGGPLPPQLPSFPTSIIVSAVVNNMTLTTSFSVTVAISLPTFSDTTFGDLQSGDVGSTLPTPLIVQLTNGFGPVGGVGVYWTVLDGPAGTASASLNPPVSLSDGAGFARTTVTIGPKAGSGILIRATVPGISGGVTFTLRATGGPPSRIDILQGNNQQSTPGATLPLALRVQVISSGGSPLALPSALFPLTFTVSPPEAATLSAFFQQPDGQASVLVTLSNRLGPFTVTASSGGVSAVFNLRAVTNAAAIVGLSGNNQRVAVGGTTTDQLVARVIDSINNPVGGVPVSITAPAGVSLVPVQGTAANPLTVTSEADGRVRFFVRAGPGTAVGQLTVTASFSIEGRSGSFAFTVFVDGPKPVFTTASVVNAGSFVQGLSPYGLSTLFGTNLSTVSGIEFPGGATTYKGVTLKIDGIAVPLYLVRNESGQEQINFQARSDLVSGSRVRVEVTNNGTTTAVDGIQVLQVQPGIFEYTPQGSSLRYAVAVKLNSTVVGPNNPLSRGEIFLVFFTGGGVTLPLLSAGQLAPSNPPAVTFSRPTVGIGGGGAEVLFSGVTPTFAGLYQLNVRVPDNAPLGASVALVIIMENTASQDSRIAIQ